jgi:hypothetical protein
MGEGEGTEGTEGTGSEGTGTEGAGDGFDLNSEAAKAAITAEVERIVGGRTAAARREAERQVADKLGVSIDEAGDLLKQAKAQADKDKTEAEKAREAADKAAKDADTVKSESASTVHRLLVKDALRDADCPKDKLERATKLVALDVEVGAGEDEIATAVKTLTKDFPELFAAASDDGAEGEGEGQGKPEPKGKLPNGDPPGKPPSGQKGEDAFQRGVDRAKKMAEATAYPILQEQAATG